MKKNYITKNNVFRVFLDVSETICHMEMKMPGKSNKINYAFVEDLREAIDVMSAYRGIAGVILSSDHNDFCVGADLDMVLATNDPISINNLVKNLCLELRRLETCKKPVVALLTGSALGGGFEIALACHRRIALASPRFRIGLLEVSLGLIPGAGGTQRLPRLIGLQSSIEAILQAKSLDTNAALNAGFIDAIYDTRAQLLQEATIWIEKNPTYRQPWDKKPTGIPVPAPQSEEARHIFMEARALLEEKNAGAMLAPQLALRAIQEGLHLSFDKGMETENHYFLQVISGQQSKDMIRTLWLYKSSAEKQEGLPYLENARIKTVGIIGAGMMGAGLASVCANFGFNVILKDIAQKNLDRALERCRLHCKEAVMARIQAVLENQPLASCDLIIEAVFENLELKHQILQEVEPLLQSDTIWASNTSALPITEIAKKSLRPANIIGLHYFSPPEKMQLVEIICSKNTSEETLARSLAFSKTTRKIPIVVNDAYAFYTSRIFFAYIMEAAELVAQGYNPLLIECAAKKAGMVVAPLKVSDEVTLTLMVHAMSESEQYWGKLESKGLLLIQKLVNLGRTGKAAKKGFYEYDGKRQIWRGLKELVGLEAKDQDITYLQKRLMLIQCAQVAQTIELGIIKQHRDAEIGAIFGIGFAPQTGGPLAYMDNYGLKSLVNDLEIFSKTCGARYAPAPLLYKMAENHNRFHT
jgi:3-hydroxyacyl-CoA dehydrogenase / enoyl-CoA hydratase / 3-hydroxybutyryl-CoA epimerase